MRCPIQQRRHQRSAVLWCLVAACFALPAHARRYDLRSGCIRFAWSASFFAAGRRFKTAATTGCAYAPRERLPSRVSISVPSSLCIVPVTLDTQTGPFHTRHVRVGGGWLATMSRAWEALRPRSPPARTRERTEHEKTPGHTDASHTGFVSVLGVGVPVECGSCSPFPRGEGSPRASGAWGLGG